MHGEMHGEMRGEMLEFSPRLSTSAGQR